ncbi:MAG TPA: C25 family cysteine peptidase [Pyrinomonadaceae bacterium]
MPALLASQSFVLGSVVNGGNDAGKLVSATANAANEELQLISAGASATPAGVLLRWRTNFTPDNLGFNVYRLKQGERTRANRELIPGAAFAPRNPTAAQAGYSYSWFDRGGSADATYFIESVNLDGVAKLYQPITPVNNSKTTSEFEQTAAAASASDSDQTPEAFSQTYPAAEAQQPNLPSGDLQQQWAIAGQTALKIAVKRDGWYRITQPQMAAAGFNPSVDIRNLRLFVDANEVAINTSQSSGPFGSSDFIEFYGVALNIATTDVRTYYLIAGTTPGKRVGGEIHVDGNPNPPPPSLPSPSPAAPGVSSPSSNAPLRNPIFFTPAPRDYSVFGTTLNPAPEAATDTTKPDTFRAKHSEPVNPAAQVESAETVRTTAVSESRSAPAAPGRSLTASPAKVIAAAAANRVVPKDSKTVITPAASRASAARRSKDAANAVAGSRARKRRAVKRSRKPRRAPERHHAAILDSFAPANFQSSFQIRDRLFYISNLLNGDQENFFGRVISTSPVTQTLVVSNADLAASSATLEFALQGVLNQSAGSHNVTVALNGVTLGSVLFGALEHPVQTYTLPMSQLHQGNNSITFTKTSTGEVCLIDYIRLTYPHAFVADSGALKFPLRGSQSLDVDGFSSPSVLVIDYTDPLNVILTQPESHPTANGYAITVSENAARSKAQRLLYAIPQGQFEQPAALTLNQPSTWNSTANAGAFLVVTHKSFLPDLAPLLNKRQSEGLSTALVNVEDVYDEFGYGVHGPQALKDFLQFAATHWSRPPRYVVFAGDASFDPHDYFHLGDFDFVPTKLVDATYNESASDDWLTDFDNDGVGDIPVGRLPLRSSADASLVVSKIINFTPVTPEAALLIADDPGTPAVWDFETASDDVQALLPQTMAVQRLNVRTEPSPSQATTDIINAFAAGRSVVNYSGHGNVDIWSGASIFSSANATALTNGNKLPFVIVMDCLNGYYNDPILLSLAEAFLKAPQGGAIATFASSGLTTTFGQRQMELELYRQLYGSQPIALGDAIKIAKTASGDIDVRRTWIYFGDPSIKIR